MQRLPSFAPEQATGKTKTLLDATKSKTDVDPASESGSSSQKEADPMRLETSPDSGCVSAALVQPETIKARSDRTHRNQILQRSFQSTLVDLPHGQQEHLLYCSWGQQEEQKQVRSHLKVEGRAYEWRNLPDRAITFIPAGYPFEWEWTYSTNSIHLLISPDSMTHFAEEIEALRSATGELKPQFRIRDSFADTLLSQLGREISGDGYGAALAVDALTNLLSLHVLRAYRGQTALSRPARAAGLSRKQKASLTEYIEDSLGENVRLENMSEIAGLSQFHFARQFKAAFGQSPHEYQLHRRIRRAGEVLRAQPEDTLAKVAASFGFADESHFRRHFKRIFGVTPGQYRAEFQK